MYRTASEEVLALIKHGSKPSVLLAVVALTSFLLGGCATLSRGSDEDIMMNSNPSGAAIYVDGNIRGMTPDTLRLARRKTHSIEVRKEGYGSKSVVVNHSIGAGWVGLDLCWAGVWGLMAVVGQELSDLSSGGHSDGVAGGTVVLGVAALIPTLVDASTGKWYSLNQDSLYVVLEQEPLPGR